MSYRVTSKKTGKTYFLHERKKELKGGQEVTLFYFAGEPGDEAIHDLPEGYEIFENPHSGLPDVKKKPA